MDKPQSDARAAGPSAGASATQPPLLGLVELLRTNGFMVTTDDYVHLLKILELYGNELPEALALRISPIIATRPEEQERCYVVLAQYFRQQAARVTVPDQKPVSWMRRMVWIVLLLGLAAGVYLLLQKPPLRLPETAPALNLPLDSPYTFDLVATGMFAGREGDTTDLKVSWEDSGRGPIGSGLRVHHVFREAGLHRVRAIAEGAARNHSVFRQEVRVCPGVMTTTLTGTGDVVTVGQTFLLSAHSQPAAGPEGYRWDSSAIAGYGHLERVNDSSVRIRIDTPGVYQMAAVPRRAEVLGYCFQGGSISIVVEDSSSQFEAGIRPGKAPELSRELRPAVHYLTLLCLAAIAFLSIRRRRKKKTPDAQTLQPPEPRSTLPASVWELAFPNKHEPEPGESLRRFFQMLRTRAEEEVQGLDIPASIRTSIRKGGLESLVFAPRRSMQQYLFFIDARQAQGLWFSLCEQMARWMMQAGIPTQVFYYDHDFQCGTTLAGNRHALRQVVDEFPVAIPIIMGDGDALLHPLGGSLLPALTEQLQRWSVVLWITPLPRPAWSSREQLLARHFLLAAADETALLHLAGDFQAGRKTRWDRIEINTGSHPHDFKSVAGLRAYLSNDAAMIQWLCALCIYPKPRWDLCVAFGRTILGQYGRQAGPVYEELLQMSRIPWLREGSFPQRLRMELLKTLEPEHEIAVRATLLDLMQSSHALRQNKEGLNAEQELQEAINGFVLHAHDPIRFAAQEALSKKFRVMLQAGEISDAPARKYLEGGNWSTPLQLQGKTMPLQHFVRHQEDEAAEEQRRHHLRSRRKMLWKAVATSLAALSLMGIWSLLSFSETAQHLPWLKRCYRVDSMQMIPVRYEVHTNFSGCGDSLKRLRVLPATLQTEGRPYGMQFDPTSQVLHTQVPMQVLSAGQASLTLSISGSMVPLTIPIDAGTANGVLSITCRKGVPTVAGPADSLPSYLNEIWRSESAERWLNINLTQGRVYYAEGSKTQWTSYEIDTVIKRSGDRLLVVLQGPKGYAAMFIGNAEPQGFNLAFCAPGWTSPTEAMNADADCSTPNMMILDYDEQEPRLVQLPVTQTDGVHPPLQASELARLMQQLQAGRQNSRVLFITQFTNRNYLNMRDYSLSELRTLIGNSLPATRIFRRKQSLPGVPNPFRREALQLQWQQNNATTQPTGTKAQTEIEQKSDGPENANNPPDYKQQAEPGETDWTKWLRSKNPVQVQQARYQLARQYLSQGNAGQAIRYLNQNISASSPSGTWRSSSYLLLAQYYEQQGDRSRAAQILERALKEESDPKQAEIIRQRLQDLTPKKSSAY